MTIQPLSDDSPLSQEVLPSVWAGYKKSPNIPTLKATDQVTEVLQEKYAFSHEEANKIAKHFWMGSLHDFCVQYLGAKLTDEDHAKILRTANDIIKNGTIVRVDKDETDLIRLLAVKVVLNAHQRAHYVMRNACFLNELGMLPKENIFMLQKGISPVFYEKDEFDRSEMLKNKIDGVPEDRLWRAFIDWFYRAGIRYIPAFNQLEELSKSKARIDAPILKEAVKSCEGNKRRIVRRGYPSRYRRHSWRGYGE